MIIEQIFLWVATKLSINQNIEDFREEIKGIVIETTDLTTGRNPAMLKSNIRQYRKEARRLVFADIPFFVGLIGILFGIQISSPIIEVLSLIITVGSSFRAATVGLMAYQVPTARKTVPELEFMRAWNKGPVSKYSNSLLFPLIAILMKIHPRGYHIGMKILTQWAKDEL